MSPRPAGRGQPTVSSSSPLSAVKKPDPNMKGGTYLILFKYIFLFLMQNMDHIQMLDPIELIDYKLCPQTFLVLFIERKVKVNS